MIKNLVFFSLQMVSTMENEVPSFPNCNCVHYFAMCPYEIIEKEES